MRVDTRLEYDFKAVSTAEIKAIDVHAHFGLYRREGGHVDEFSSGDARTVVSRAAAANFSTKKRTSVRGPVALT